MKTLNVSFNVCKSCPKFYPFFFFSLLKFEPIIKQEHTEATFDWANILLVRCFLQQYVSTVDLYLQRESKLHNMVT